MPVWKYHLRKKIDNAAYLKYS